MLHTEDWWQAGDAAPMTCGVLALPMTWTRGSGRLQIDLACPGVISGKGVASCATLEEKRVYHIKVLGAIVKKNCPLRPKARQETLKLT